MAAPKGSRPWTDADDKPLLFSILATHDVKFDYNRVAEHLDDGRTGLAIQKHLKKMKDSINAGAPLFTVTTSNRQTAELMTPKRKNPNAAKTKTKDTGRSDGEDVGEVSPTKKAKTWKRLLTTMKQEDENEA